MLDNKTTLCLSPLGTAIQMWRRIQMLANRRSTGPLETATQMWREPLGQSPTRRQVLWGAQPRRVGSSHQLPGPISA